MTVTVGDLKRILGSYRDEDLIDFYEKEGGKGGFVVTSTASALFDEDGSLVSIKGLRGPTIKELEKTLRELQHAEHEAWTVLCEMLQRSGAVSELDLKSPVNQCETGGQILLARIRRWAELRQGLECAGETLALRKGR